ncbi:hypothetical protein AC578_5710 [Pseudocercospora eumusae]|uniref:FAD-binding PCMH-type domain-containing protein n=1 Tax=Pseudocercospora eumusae TaxID=321146 RepID=A0A139HEP4_9PEZI|nr:hypothetical protein AC578_5710 [Pseudocercospora eumusae]
MAISNSFDNHLPELESLASTIYTKSSSPEKFHEHTAPWSKWANRNPKAAIVPQTLDELQRIIKYLYASDLDFSIRNTGTGGSSATDIVVSMQNFKQFDFNAEDETVILGAGLSWGEVDSIIEEKYPGYGFVGARCTWVGVTGGTLVGGLSWLSHEYGMFSDPHNFLDAQVVLKDGSVVWAAKEEPDLMWASRGGGGNFGVVAALKVKVRKVPSDIFGGIVVVPYSSLEETSRAVAAMHRRPTDEKVAVHIANTGPGMGMPDKGAKPDIAIMPIDFRGEAHARSDEGFGWAWKITGAQEVVAFAKSLREINALSNSYKSEQNTHESWGSAAMISGIDDFTLVRAWKWYEDSVNLHPGFSIGSTVLLEFMQEAAFNSVSSPTDTAWPHGRGRRHVMQVVLGCPEGSKKDVKGLAMEQFSKLHDDVGGPEYSTEEWHAGFLQEFNDLSKVYGENWGRLKEVKKKYDPENRFNKGVDIGNVRTSEGTTISSAIVPEAVA